MHSLRVMLMRINENVGMLGRVTHDERAEYSLDGVILRSGELEHDVCVCVYVRTAS